MSIKTNKLTVNGTATIQDLNVTGTQVIINTLQVDDNTVLVNRTETGVGVTAGKAGMEVERGTATNYEFVFQESDDTFRIGELGTTQAVATRQDTPISNGVPYWDATSSSFLTETYLAKTRGGTGITSTATFPASGTIAVIGTAQTFTAAQTFQGGILGYGALPVGSIFAWIGGYFTNASNGSFTSVLGNTIATANAYLNSSGVYVCDGSALNDAASPIFNGAGRYLPNLTDSRFLMGSTTSGSIGGSTNVTLTAANIPGGVSVSGTTNIGHTHAASTVTGTTNIGHSHSLGTTPATISASIAANGAHDHNPSSAAFKFLVSSDAAGAAWGTLASGSAYYTTGSRLDLTDVQGSHSHTISGTTDINHSHTLGETNVSLVSGSAAGQTLGTTNVSLVSGQTSNGAQTAFENRPLYLSVFYVMRVK